MAPDLLLQINHTQALLSSSKCNLSSASMSVSFAFTDNFTLSGASAQSQKDCWAQKTLSRKIESLQMKGIKSTPMLGDAGIPYPTFYPIFSRGMSGLRRQRLCLAHLHVSELHTVTSHSTVISH